MKRDIGINARPIITKRRKKRANAGGMNTKNGYRLVLYTGKKGGQWGWANPEGK